MNLDYRHWTFEELKHICEDLRDNLHVKIVRTVLKPDERDKWNEYHDLLESYGIALLAVQARESGPIAWYFDYKFEYLQIGNEPFNSGDSSFQQTPEEVNHFIFLARASYPSRIIIAPGLADGDETKLDLLNLSMVDYVAVHPGVETQETVDAYLDRYVDHSNGLKLFVTEFYNPLITGQVFAHPRVHAAMFFCYDDRMVPNHGLYNHGEKKPAYDIYISQLESVPVADLNVGAGVFAEMESRGDRPIRDSKFVTNMNGTTYEKAYGEKGIYEASNANGDWRVYFRPFQ